MNRCTAARGSVQCRLPLGHLGMHSAPAGNKRVVWLHMLTTPPRSLRFSPSGDLLADHAPAERSTAQESRAPRRPAPDPVERSAGSWMRVTGQVGQVRK